MQDFSTSEVVCTGCSLTKQTNQSIQRHWSYGTLALYKSAACSTIGYHSNSWASCTVYCSARYFLPSKSY